MDQIPLPFILARNSSLNHIGHEAWVASVGGCGLRKRQATLMPTIRAQGKQIVPLVIIFRGTGAGIKDTELEYYRSLPGIVVKFQPKAWCDERVMVWYVREVLVPALAAAGISREILMFLDNLGAHKTDYALEAMRAVGVYFEFTAPGCTDVCAPVGNLQTSLSRVCVRAFHI